MPGIRVTNWTWPWCRAAVPVGSLRAVAGVWKMATFRTSAEVFVPDHPLMQRGQTKGFSPGVVVADVLRQTGGAYETTTPLTEKFRDCIRAVAKLTSDDELLRIADLPEVPVSLENCRQLDPQTRVILICRLDVSPVETPRWRRIPPLAFLPGRGANSAGFLACAAALASRSAYFSQTAGACSVWGQPRTSRHNAPVAVRVAVHCRAPLSREDRRGRLVQCSQRPSAG